MSVRYIPMRTKDGGYTRCPYGMRDSLDLCYEGIGGYRCEWFVRYDWCEHYGHVACSYDGGGEQLDLFGSEE